MGEGGGTTTKKTNKMIRDTPKRPKGFGARHTTAVLGFWAMCILYALRFNLSIAIVAMVKTDDKTNSPSSSSSSSGHLDNGDEMHISNRSLSELEETCAHLKSRFDSMMIDDNDNTSTKTGGLLSRMIKAGRQKTESLMKASQDESSMGEFNWTRKEQGIILGSFFWGHVLTQIPGGMVAQRYGTKWTLLFGILSTALLALVTPCAARLSQMALIIVRILQGLVGGVVWPAMHLVIGKWAPPDERSKLISIVYAGPQFGTAISTVACGYMIDWNWFGGWPSAFYVLGAFSLIWVVFWCLFMFDSPEDHPRISPEELHYIEGSLGDQLTEKKLPTPWKAILTSVPLWAILIAHVGEDYGLYTMLIELPSYMKSVLHFNIRENSWMSALPQIGRWAFSIIFPLLADYLIHKKYLRVVQVRKICNTIAHWGAAAALIGVSYLGCDPTMTVVVLTLSITINGAVNGGCITNHVDIAANHAGVLMGITNTAANLMGVIAPFVAGTLTDESATLDQWQIIFFIAAAVLFFDNIIYVLFASGSEQPWNRGRVKEDTNNYPKNIETGSKPPTCVGQGDKPPEANQSNPPSWILVNETKTMTDTTTMDQIRE